MAREGIIPHPQEQQRLESLHRTQILETPIEQRFEHITTLLRTIFDVPVSALSFVDLHRQWFKSSQGIDVEQTERCVAFCQHTILQNEVFEINDARLDPRFENHPLVTGELGIVFYAGAPVYSQDAMPIASLCIIDRHPRTLDQRERDILTQMARLCETLLQTPRANPIEESIVQHVGESWRAAMIDPLTRTWNSEGIRTLIQETVLHASRSKDQVGVGMLELIGLENLIVEYGHPFVDGLCREFSRRAVQSMRAHDSIGHLRPGEFGFVMTRVLDREDLMNRMLMLQQIVDKVASNAEQPTELTARVGCRFITTTTPISPLGAMEQVEEALSGMDESEWADPMIIGDKGDASQPSAA